MISNRKRARAFSAFESSSTPSTSSKVSCARQKAADNTDDSSSSELSTASSSVSVSKDNSTTASSRVKVLLNFQSRNRESSRGFDHCVLNNHNNICSSSSPSSSSVLDTDAYAAYSLFSVNNMDSSTCSPQPLFLPQTPTQFANSPRLTTSSSSTKKKRTLSLPQLPQVKCFYSKLAVLNTQLPPKFGRVTAQVIPCSDKSTSCDDKNGHYIIRENQMFANRFKIIRQLGQGTFGKVVQCYDTHTREHVAIKIIRNIQKYRDAARIELRVLTTIKHVDTQNSNHCIHLRECFEFRGHICFVTDLLRILLYDFMEKNRFIAYPGLHIQAFGKQLLRLVAFLHDLNLIHTDLKPENILLHDDSFVKKAIRSRVISASYAHLSRNNEEEDDDDNHKLGGVKESETSDISSSSTANTPGVLPAAQKRSGFSNLRRAPRKLRILVEPLIQIIDFGSAVFDDETHSPVVSTRHYRAPEIILEIGWLFPCDMWSLGCILAELAIGEPLFRTHENLEHLAMIEKVCGGQIDKKLVRMSQARGTALVQTFFTAPYRESSGSSSKNADHVNTTSVTREFISRKKKGFVVTDAFSLAECDSTLSNVFTAPEHESGGVMFLSGGEDDEGEHEEEDEEEDDDYNDDDDDDDDDDVIFDSKATARNALTLRYPLPATSSASIERVDELSRIDLFISRRLGLDINFDYTLSSNYDRNKRVINFGNFTFWWFYIDLLRKLLQVDPAKRITASDALHHPWFNLGVEDEGTV